MTHHQHPVLRACVWTLVAWLIAIAATILMVSGVACGVLR